MSNVSDFGQAASATCKTSRKVANVWRWATALAVGTFTLASTVTVQAAPALADHPARGGHHVLLLSVDGLHASDLSQWIAANPTSNLAALSGEGTAYTNAATS